ncbi:MAG TPA: glycosyltransferase family 2 protein [Kofleriaceae bacterium]|jgi:glycosyltransferase involved in cell wall biosynthesis
MRDAGAVNYHAAVNDLVSVVIPSYNRAYCVAATIDSVLAQTHSALEILLVDDGSTDDTRALIEQRYGDEPRVRYIHQANAGVSAARNHGLRLARGTFIALLDSDDIWLPWKIEAQLRCLEALPTAGMIWTDMDAIGPDGQLLHHRYLTRMYTSYRKFTRDQLFRESRPLSSIDARLAGALEDPRVYLGDIFSPMITGNLVHTSTVLLRRERFEKVSEFDVNLRYSGEDHDFHLRTCREGDVAYLDISSILYQHGREDQLTVNRAYTVHMAENFLTTVNKALARDRERVTLSPAMLDRVMAEAHAWIGEQRLDIGDRDQAWRHLGTSLRFRPWQPRVAALLGASMLPKPVSDRLRASYRALKAQLRGHERRS